MSDNNVLVVENLGKKVPSTESGDTSYLAILDGVNFSIDRGDSVAIIGPSGAGKSTLLGLMAGLDAPSAGKVWIDGEELFAISEDQRARLRGEKLGFVFQSFQLLPNLTALENVMLPLEISGRKDASAAALKVLERVGLSPRLYHYPRQLSGGEQQRVAIARAFAPHPQLLLADEPTGNLDAVTGEKVIDLLFELNREQQTTLILVTHDDNLARRCNRRLELANGKLLVIS